MNLQTFSAPTMAEALGRVKSEMGSDAIILHTRTYSRRIWLGLRRREVVEITAGSGVNIQSRGLRRGAAAANGHAAALRTRPALTTAMVTTPQVSRPAPRNVLEGSRQLLETPAASMAAMMSLSQDMTSLKGMVADMVSQQRKSACPQVPEDLFDYYLQLIQNQVAEEVAADMMRELQTQLRPEHLRNPQFVRDKIADQLEKLLPVAGPIIRKKGSGTHVVALIGPTGVGKTTTIAKLAANLKLRENYRVGLITIDTYRIAAVDQLKKYADIIGAPLKVVNSPEELRDAVAAMSDCDFVLIDTAGRSPSDTLKLNELRNFITMVNPDEVHLVLSTTASQECIESAIAKFTNVRVDKIIFTKLDEAVHVGVMLNVIKKVNKSLSYITTGQDVPDDIEVGRGRRLAELILGDKL